MSWPSFFGGALVVIAAAIAGAGLWMHEPVAILAIIPAATAAGCIASACEGDK